MSWRTTRAAAQAASEPRHVAVIDLGSNSWRLVIYSYGPDEPQEWWKQTDELYESVRIGSGMAATGVLSEDAINRGLETLGIFARFCHANGLRDEDVHVFATSAIRDAGNREPFLARVRESTGYDVEVLSTTQEAHYGYVAAINSTTIANGVVLDIGGGSMQLIQVEDRRERTSVSLPIGAVRMTEAFLSDGDPDKGARKKDLQRLRDHLAERLAEAGWLSGHGGRMVGTGGAVRNLAAAAQRAQFGASGGTDIGIQGFVVGAEALDQLVDTLAALPAGERRGVPGIKPGRGDIILAAAVALQTVVQIGGFEGIEATESGLRDGIFLARTILGEDEPRFPDVRRAAVRNLAVQYESDLPHTEHVAHLALQMHESLAENGLFEPEPGEAELLWAAAMLHDVGMTISYGDHHKHSCYLIVSAELPGFDPRERALIAQITRYHRKGVPKLGEWAKLARDGDEEMLDRCALVLRLAEHLERGRDQSVSEVHLRTNGDGISLHLLAEGDLMLPRWSIERYGDGEAFERTFHRPLVIG
ncbi:MAG TPA: Ppx/GppA phosphatase family protein [Solirubrobacteraceae bacterium]|jgi:exopolyphosphatase/guanosine-5'-triphosphate,3'-diphosphate pyrophosphatase|nr:Ppx/GppA phosphatase family protein [Solirubrobacteraceae bacterium]